MPYRLTPNQPIHAQLRYCDVVSSQYGPQVKLKAIIAGVEEHVYLPGSASDVLTALLAAGVIAEAPAAFPDPGDTRGVALRLTARDVVLTLEKPTPRAAARLVVAKNGLAAPAPAAESPRGAPVAPAATPLPAVPASDSIEAKRAAVTASFRSALDVAAAELLPAFAAAHVPVDADALYKLGFSLWQRWIDHGAA